MDVYAMITNRVIESLEKGTVPWQKPWAGGKFGQPRNFVSTKPYRGINVFLLSETAEHFGYSSPFWVSFKQAQQMGGTVRDGEKSHSPVVFYSQVEKKELTEDGEKETYGLLRYTPMFNTDQCDGLTVPDLSDGIEKHEHEIIASAQALVDNMPNRPVLNIQQSSRAYYMHHRDSITVPEMNQFRTPEEFYSTLFHEMGHSTGHPSRLGREFGANFGDHLYSKEELVAEFTASYLCGVAGIENRTIENSSAYLNSWLTILKDSKQKKWLPWAAGQAQKAADYIQGVNVETEQKVAA